METVKQENRQDAEIEDIDPILVTSLLYSLMAGKAVAEDNDIEFSDYRDPMLRYSLIFNKVSKLIVRCEDDRPRKSISEKFRCMFKKNFSSKNEIIRYILDTLAYANPIEIETEQIFLYQKLILDTNDEKITKYKTNLLRSLDFGDQERFNCNQEMAAALLGSSIKSIPECSKNYH